MRTEGSGAGSTLYVADHVSHFEAARVMATNYKADAELQSERATEQRTDLLPQIASLETDLAQAQARIASLEEQLAEYKASVVGELRGLVESHMDLDRGQWQCVPVVEAARAWADDPDGPNKWYATRTALAALDAAKEQPDTP